jgi:photosystem II stability/assembly factor-like uncharacterized protein
VAVVALTDREYHLSMDHRLLLGTERGLWTLRGDALEPVEAFAARDVTALARDGARTWAVIEGRSLWASDERGPWRQHASIDGLAATCLAPTSGGLLVGTEQAHLLRLVGGELSRVESFETVDGRGEWHTPWGDPADVRSMAVATDGTIHVNVHVGGVVRSRDGGRSWTPTVDIDADVHQVLTHPTRPDVVLAAAYEGFGISRDGGDTWEFVTDGMHAHYSRAVTMSGDTVLVSASTGPRGRRAALYRKLLDGGGRFERCHDRLPWFDDNIDTACLAAAGPVAVFGTEDGRLFRSLDSGERWELVTKGMPSVRCVTLG